MRIKTPVTAHIQSRPIVTEGCMATPAHRCKTLFIHPSALTVSIVSCKYLEFKKQILEIRDKLSRIKNTFWRSVRENICDIMTNQKGDETDFLCCKSEYCNCEHS